AELVDQADLPLGVPETDQRFAQQLDPHGRPVALGDLGGLQRGQPVAAEEPAHQRARADAGQRVVLLSADHSFLAPEARTIGAQRRSSSCTKALNSFGSSRFGVMPSWRMRSRTSESSSARRTSLLSLSTTSLGRPAGPESENHTVATRSG